MLPSRFQRVIRDLGLRTQAHLFQCMCVCDYTMKVGDCFFLLLLLLHCLRELDQAVLTHETHTEREKSDVDGPMHARACVRARVHQVASLSWYHNQEHARVHTRGEGERERERDSSQHVRFPHLAASTAAVVAVAAVAAVAAAAAAASAVFT